MQLHNYVVNNKRIYDHKKNHNIIVFYNDILFIVRVGLCVSISIFFIKLTNWRDGKNSLPIKKARIRSVLWICVSWSGINVGFVGESDGFSFRSFWVTYLIKVINEI